MAMLFDRVWGVCVIIYDIVPILWNNIQVTHQVNDSMDMHVQGELTESNEVIPSPCTLK